MNAYRIHFKAQSPGFKNPHPICGSRGKARVTSSQEKVTCDRCKQMLDPNPAKRSYGYWTMSR